MMKRNSSALLILLTSALLCLSVLFSGCHASSDAGGRSAANVDTLHYVNLTILLDLSDRLSHPGQIERDTAIIRKIVDDFQDQVGRNHYQYSKDKIQLLVAPQADNRPINFNPYIDIEQEVRDNKIIRQILPGKVEDFMKQVRDIYAGHPKFTGADIWTFFRDMPASLIKKSYAEKVSHDSVYYDFKNEMIILTDGYMAFDRAVQERREQNRTCMQVSKLRSDPNWEEDFSKYKMKPVSGKDFGNLTVLMLEISPFKPQIYTNEISIIQKYWQTWFSDMNVRLFALQQNNEAIPLIDATVRNFMAN